MATWLDKDFKKATQNDLLNLVSALDMKDYSEYTKYDFKIVLKTFYKWLLGEDEEFPKVIKWLKPKLKNKKHKLPEELLSVEEVQKLAKATTNPRDKARILVNRARTQINSSDPRIILGVFLLHSDLV